MTYADCEAKAAQMLATLPEGTHTTKSQRKALVRFLWLVVDAGMMLTFPDKYEFKKVDLTASSSGTGLLFAFATTGLKGDEGSMAEVYARYNFHVAIGKRGAMTQLGLKAPRRSRPVDGYLSRDTY